MTPLTTIGRRLGAAATTMLCAAFLSFLILHFAPGDRARIVANARYGGEGAADPVVLAAIRAELGLDRPMLVQFAGWLGSALQLDFGRSFVNRQPVIDVMLRAYQETIPIALAAFTAGVMVAILLASAATLCRQSWLDRLIVAVASFGAALPSFWAGLLFILLFSVSLGWLPAYGTGSPTHGVLPAATLSVWIVATKTRLFRGFLIEALAAPHLDVLRIRGVGEATILFRHLLPHAVVATLPILCLDLALMIEGAVIVETVFARPGVGAALLGALQARDYPVVLALVVVAAGIYTAANFIADGLARMLDPRLRRLEPAAT